jgi:hypothetical protein
MKLIKTLAAVAALVITSLTLSGQVLAQQIPAASVGPMNAYSIVCNSQSVVAFGFDCVQNLDTGSVFALSGGTGSCTGTSSIAGGATRGQFKCTAAAGASTVLVTFGAGGLTAATGWVCSGWDVTTAAAVSTSASTTTTATLKFTNTAASDLIAFSCFGY